jgi:MerR family transcriptional regulator, repressor of the yfmOP operon
MAVAQRSLRIGELAKLAETTPRTVRYYEEIGLLAEAGERESGEHRTYTAADVERLREILRLKSLLGLTLDELRDVMRGEDARAERKRAWHETDDPELRRRLLAEASDHLERLLELVGRHKQRVEAYEGELLARRERLRAATP